MVKGKNRLKTLLSVFAALFLAFAFSGCGEYTPPAGSGSNPSGPVKPDDPTPRPPAAEDDDFTVQLLCSRGDFTANIYSDITKIQVQWTDTETNEVFRAGFDKDGKASRSGLDGDFRVTLVTLPDGYTYEPNNYTATNDLKDVRIMLYELTPISLSLTPYSGWPESFYYYTIDSIGAYRVVLHDENEKVFFGFKPKQEGMYSVESLVDITADEVNPLIDVHFGNFPNYANQMIGATQDGGGPSGTYAKNFKWEYNISASEVGNGILFRLYSTCRNDPDHAYGRSGLIVDFIIDREGSFKNQYEISEDIPTPDEVDPDYFLKTPAKPSGSYLESAERDTTGKNILSAKNIKLVEETVNYKDGTGADKQAKMKFYWYCDENGNPEARVYANFTGNPFINFTNPYHQAKLGWLAPDADSSAKNYYYFVMAYLKNLNADGCYPVDEGLRTFLEDFALAQRPDLFYDGRGAAERMGYQSDEDSMWLFACGYYG